MATSAIPEDLSNDLGPQTGLTLDLEHSNSLHIDTGSKTASPRSRSRAFTKIELDVGGQRFTTTKSTLAGSRLFAATFRSEAQSEGKLTGGLTPKSNMMSFIENPNASTFDSIDDNISVGGAEHKVDGKEDLRLIPSAQIFAVEPNHYFVDRSPTHFGRILQYLRSINTLSADYFLERYYLVDPAAFTLLLELQDEVSFYDIPSLSDSIEVKVSEITSRCSLHDRSSSMLSTNLHDRSSSSLRIGSYSRCGQLDTPSTTLHGPALSGGSPRLHTMNAVIEHCHSQGLDSTLDTSWWDRSGPLGGLRRIKGTRIAFATAMDNWVATDARFEAPAGFIWAKQSQYLAEYHQRRKVMGAVREWIHFGVGGWQSYRWKYARKVAFIFSDTFRSKRFVHSGMEICDINHVKSLFGLMAESPLMDYDENRGIVEGFAGLVLLSDEVWNGEPVDDGMGGAVDCDCSPDGSPQHIKMAKGLTVCDLEDEKAADDAVSTPIGDRKQKRKSRGDAADRAKVDGLKDDDSSTEWTSDGDDEHIQELLSLEEQKAKTVLKPATVPYPAEGPPVVANCFENVTRRRQAALTKQNLHRHTKVQMQKYSEQKRRLSANGQRHVQVQQRLTLNSNVDGNGNGNGNGNAVISMQSPAAMLSQGAVNGVAASPRQWGLSAPATESQPGTPRLSGYAPSFRPTLTTSHSFKGTAAQRPPMHHIPPQWARRHTASTMQSPHFVATQRPPQWASTPPQEPVNAVMASLGSGPRPRPSLTQHLSINSLPPRSTERGSGHFQ